MKKLVALMLALFLALPAGLAIAEAPAPGRVLSCVEGGAGGELSLDTLKKIAKAYGRLKEIGASFKSGKRSADVQEIIEALKPYLGDFMKKAAPAVRLGAPEKGAFKSGEGVSYNTRQPIHVDKGDLDDALDDMISTIVRDEKVIAALDGLGASAEDLRKLPAFSKYLSAVDMNLYSHTDDSGAVISPDRCVRASVTLPGLRASATLELHLREKGVDAVLNIPGIGENGNFNASFTFAPFDWKTAAGGISRAADA